MKTVTCQSGLSGSQMKLRENYANYQEFVGYCEIFAIHTRLGFKSMKRTWQTNPTIQLSVNPNDLKVVK
jgi:hypothetical protein